MPLDNPEVKPAIQPTGIQPVFPTEPPKEVKEMTFSLDPGLIQNSGDSVVKIDGKEVKTENAEIKKEEPPVKLEEVKKEEPKKEEAKVEPKKEEAVKEKTSGLKPPKEEKKEPEVTHPKKEVEVKSAAVKPITPVKEKKEGEQDAFDYSKYSPQETTNLKNMSRQSREYTAKLIDENKQLAGLKDANYLQHESAYMISPEFQELQQKDYLVRTEAQCWERALLSIKAGKPFKDITGFDSKTGQPIMSEDIQPSDADEVRVANNLTACIQAAQQVSGNLQQYPNRYKQQINTDLQSIKQVQNERFAWHQDPKLLEHTVEIEGRGDIKVKDIKQEFKSVWPAYLANSPAVDVAADIWVAMQIQASELREAKNGQQIAQIKQAEISRGEPSSDAQPTNEAKNGQVLVKGKPVPSVFSLEGMPSR